ncbi:MAG: LamG-like jellyroll fold domain-containing protein [Planctomycetota bacterium]|jgi:hypothetical protein
MQTNITAASVLLTASVLALSSSASSQNEILYYKFDRGLGTEAVNYGSAPGPSTMKKGTATTTPWTTAGQFGGGLIGTKNNASTDYAYADTGFKGPLNGAFTVSWWMKERNNPGTGLSYVWGGVGSFRCFTNGVAGTTLWVRSWGGADIKMPTVGNNIQVRARAKGGVCVAVVVFPALVGWLAQWYVDGVPHGAAQNLTQGAAVAASTSTFKIGKHSSNSSSSVYDMDEFRLFNRLASPTEIKSWCTAPRAARGDFGAACGKLNLAGAVPTVGNARHTFTISGPGGTTVLMVFSPKPQPAIDLGTFFGAPLAGCNWHVGLGPLQVLLAIPKSGVLTIPVPIPNNRALAGVHVESQLLGRLTRTLSMSNALSSVVEIN